MHCVTESLAVGMKASIAAAVSACFFLYFLVGFAAIKHAKKFSISCDCPNT